MTKQIGAITLYSTEEISTLLGVGQSEIEGLIENETLFGRKVAGHWLISEDSIRTFFDAPEKQTININLDLGQYWEKLIGHAEIEKAGGAESPKIVLMKKLADATPASGLFSSTTKPDQESIETNEHFELDDEIETIDEFELAETESAEIDEFEADESFESADESNDYTVDDSFAGDVEEQDAKKDPEIKIIEVNTPVARTEQFSMPLEIDLENGIVISDPSNKPTVTETGEKTSAKAFSLEIDLTTAY